MSYDHLLNNAKGRKSRVPTDDDLRNWCPTGNLSSENNGNSENRIPEIDWKPPVPLETDAVSEFPVDALPKWLADFCAELSEFTQTPADVAGGMSLAAVAIAVQKKFAVQPSAGYGEQLSLYVMSVLPPANRKSAVVRAISNPLFEWEKSQAATMRPIIEKARSEFEVLQKRRLKLIQEIANAPSSKTGEQRKELDGLNETILQSQPPNEPRLLVDDVTTETLSTRMMQNGGRIGVLSAEDDLLAVMSGRYDKSGKPNVGLFLKAHAGDRHIVDRGSRPSEFIDSPALSAGFCVQPQVLLGMMEQKTFRGRGVLGRLLYQVPVSLLGRRNLDAAPVDPKAESRYRNRIAWLLELPMKRGNDGEIVPQILTLDADADGILRAFRERIEVQLADVGRLAHITDWAGKLPGAVVRIAGLLHVAENVEYDPLPTTITAATMQAAVRLGDYFTDHALSAFRMMGADKATDEAKYVLKMIKNHELRTFSKRDVYQKSKGRLAKADELDNPLALLETHGYIADITPPEQRRPGRRASPVWAANPNLWSDSHNPHNSQNGGK